MVSENLKSVYNSVKWLLIFACIYFVVFESPLRYWLVPPLRTLAMTFVEHFLYIIWYIFVFCSLILVIIGWMAWDNSKFREELQRYRSRLFAKDYYRGSKNYDFYKAIKTSISKYPSGNLDVENENRRFRDQGGLTTASEVQKRSIYESDIEAQPQIEDDNRTDGVHKTYHKNGKIASEVNYENGQLNGAYCVYYEDGGVRQEKYYKNGKLNGIFKAYDEYGVLYFEISYKDGKQDGLENIYYKNGIVQYQDTYRDGKRVNRKTFSESGELKSDHNFSDASFQDEDDDKDQR